MAIRAAALRLLAWVARLPKVRPVIGSPHSGSPWFYSVP